MDEATTAVRKRRSTNSGDACWRGPHGYKMHLRFLWIDAVVHDGRVWAKCQRVHSYRPPEGWGRRKYRNTLPDRHRGILQLTFLSFQDTPFSSIAFLLGLIQVVLIFPGISFQASLFLLGFSCFKYLYQLPPNPHLEYCVTKPMHTFFDLLFYLINYSPPSSY